MITGDPDEVSLYETEQLPEDMVQDADGENDPEGLLLDHETVPVGEEPVTLAMHVTEVPGVTVAGEQVTATELGCRVDVVATES